MREHQHALMHCHCAGDDGARDHGLAGAGWGDKDDPTMTLSHLALDLIDRGLLKGVDRGHGPRPSNASRARVRFTMSVRLPPGSLTRYMPGHFASGTMRRSRAGFLGEPRP
jgi:hypothetical protein